LVGILWYLTGTKWLRKNYLAFWVRHQLGERV